IPDTTLGHDVYTNIRAGNLQGLSFGFRVAQGGDRVTRKNGNIVRTITKIEKLTEISIVAVPAYEDTKLEITRSAENKLKKDDDYKAKVGVVLPLYD
ncbi:HK97 family phage prohead protease, partial [Periweissella ghanensis]